MIDDLTKDYGVTVNGNSYLSSVLQSGDRVKVGPTEFLFYSDAYEMPSVDEAIDVVAELRAT